jgi:hypothetical protein
VFHGISKVISLSPGQGLLDISYVLWFDYLNSFNTVFKERSNNTSINKKYGYIILY